MLETAACADHEGGWSLTGRGACRRRMALYAMAEVDELLLELHRAPNGVATVANLREAAKRLRDAIFKRFNASRNGSFLLEAAGL